MTLQEFAALKVGDKIVNGMNGSEGVVTGINDKGITLQWPPSTMEYSFTAQSTAWMHWRRADAEDEGAQS